VGEPLILTYGGTSQRITCPHLGQAVPSGDVTITITDEHGTTKLSSTNATKGSLSSTLASAATHGSRRITLADAAGISAGQPLVITDAWGRTETLFAEGGETATDVVVLRDPITRDYAVGATVKSALIYYDANLSATATWGIDLYYAAVFACSSWSAPRVVTFRIVKYPGLECPITFEHVRAALSAVGFLRDQYDAPDLDDVRLSAWRFIEAELYAGGRDPATLRDPERLAQAGGFLAAALFLHGRGSRELAEHLAGNPVGTGGFYGTYMGRVMKVPAWIDRDQDLVRDEGDTMPPRRGYLRRGL
jgi:hypothetical protein